MSFSGLKKNATPPPDTGFPGFTIKVKLVTKEVVELVLLSEKRIGVFKTSVPEDEMGVSESRVSVAMPLRKNESP